MGVYSKKIQTVVNFSVLITMLCLGFSGIVMSNRVFAALPIHGLMATARMMCLRKEINKIGVNGNQIVKK